MDQMLPSPSFNIPSIGTPHHAMEEDQMINPQAAAQQQQQGQNPAPNYNFGGFTPQNLLSSQTPQNLLASPAPGSASAHLQQASQTPANSSGPSGLGHTNVYAPCASPAPPSPATPMTQQPPPSMDQGIWLEQNRSFMENLSFTNDIPNEIDFGCGKSYL